MSKDEDGTLKIIEYVENTICVEHYDITCPYCKGHTHFKVSDYESGLYPFCTWCSQKLNMEEQLKNGR